MPIRDQIESIRERKSRCGGESPILSFAGSLVLSVATPLQHRGDIFYKPRFKQHGWLATKDKNIIQMRNEGISKRNEGCNVG